MKIKVLGAGCRNCALLAENAKKAASELGIQADVEKVTDMKEIVQYEVLQTPALVVDEKVVSSGKVLSPVEIARMLQKDR